MKQLHALAAVLALAGCSTPSPGAETAAVDPLDKPVLVGAPLSSRPSAPVSCPEKTDILFHPPLPEAGFVPAPPSGATVVAPQRLHAAEPDYPAASRRCREAGKVILTYCVDASGKVENVQVIESSGYARLDNAMLAWAARDRHIAGTVNGKPARYCGMHMEQTFDAPTAAVEGSHT